MFWTSLKKLSLSRIFLSAESLAKILSGCPVLQSLTLYYCHKPSVLDLSKSLHLRTLAVSRNKSRDPGPTQILAPHIHSLRLVHSQLPCTLADVSSLTEAKMEICFVLGKTNSGADILQAMVLKMLKRLQNVEKPTFGGNFLQVYVFWAHITISKSVGCTFNFSPMD